MSVDLVLREVTSVGTSASRLEWHFHRVVSNTSKEDLEAFRRGEELARRRVNTAVALLRGLAANRSTMPATLLRMLDLPKELAVDDVVVLNPSATGQVLHELACKKDNALKLRQQLLDHPNLTARTHDYIKSFDHPTAPAPDANLREIEQQQAHNRMILNLQAAQMIPDPSRPLTAQQARSEVERRGNDRRRATAAAWSGVEVDRRMFDRRVGARRAEDASSQADQ